MIYTIDGNKIDFVAVYDWYNVYINNILVLRKISKEDARDLISRMKEKFPFLNL